jgi:hypothetical protein
MFLQEKVRALDVPVSRVSRYLPIIMTEPTIHGIVACRMSLAQSTKAWFIKDSGLPSDKALLKIAVVYASVVLFGVLMHKILPKPINPKSDGTKRLWGWRVREIVLDAETPGVDPLGGHRVVEIGE